MKNLTINFEGENYNRNFPSALYRIADDSTNGLRPALEHVHFYNKHAYVSDGHMLIRQSFDFINIRGVENLEGKCLHRTVFMRIFRERSATVIAKQTCIEMQLEGYDKFNSKMLIDYSKEITRVPDYERVLDEAIKSHQSEVTTSYKQLGFNQKLFNRLLSGMKCEGISGIVFSIPSSPNRGILITDSEYDFRRFDKQVGLLMPFTIDPQ